MLFVFSADNHIQFQAVRISHFFRRIHVAFQVNFNRGTESNRRLKHLLCNFYSQLMIILELSTKLDENYDIFQENSSKNNDGNRWESIDDC